MNVIWTSTRINENINDLRSLVSGRYLHDTVRVNLESDFDLGNTSGCWWYAGQLELAEEVVILG